MPSTSSLPSASHTRAPSPRTMVMNDSRVGFAYGCRNGDGMHGTVAGGGRGSETADLRMILSMATLTRSAGKIAGAASTWLRRAASAKAADSPTRLQAAMAVTVLCSLALSIGGWYGIDRRGSAIDDAASSAAQLIRVQDVRVEMVRADSLASVAYLIGGQEPADQRQQYDEQIGLAASGLTASANAATRADAATLQQATSLLTRYVGLVEQARANNRQGFPVGAAYQRQARGVAEEVIEALRTVEINSRQRVNDSVERGHRSSSLLVISAVLVLVMVLVGSVWMARRFRRVLNLPLAVAGVIVLVVLTAGVGVNASAISQTDQSVTGPLTAADLLAQSRAAGFDARSNEALTLIARGNGAAYEWQWQLSRGVAGETIARACEDFGVACDAETALDSYRREHDAVRELDESGDWDAAVDASLGRSSDGANSRMAFEVFATRSDEALRIEAQRALDALDGAGSRLRGLGWMVIVAGIAAAVLAVVGYGQRLREYR